jgi:hypothetical protein
VAGILQDGRVSFYNLVRPHMGVSMHAKILAVLLASSILIGCGSAETDSSDSGAASVSLESLPATLEGDLVIDVAEGDVEEDGTSEYNAATLTVNGEEILVEVSGSILQSAGLSEAGGKVRATLSSKTEEYGVTVYVVSSLERL